MRLTLGPFAAEGEADCHSGEGEANSDFCFFCNTTQFGGHRLNPIPR